MVLTNGHKSTSQTPKIQLTDEQILIHDLKIVGKDAVEYLKKIPESEYERACLRAFEVGLFCLERTQTNQDTEFVKRQIQSLLTEVEKAVGNVPQTVQQELIKKLGTGEGEVLAPIHQQINQVSAATQVRLKEVKTLLTQDIDPSKENSVLGSALKSLKTLLDAKHQDSIQGTFATALEKATAENGILAKAVKTVVLESVKPLAEEVDKLTKEIRAKDAAQQALQQTIAKGLSFEEEIVSELQSWSKLNGAEIHHLGEDNKTGDILVKLSSQSLAGTELSIIIEARNRDSQPWGRQRISQHLTKAMTERGANTAIFLCSSRDGLAKEIGEWAEGTCEQGSWVATTHSLLTLALRFLVVQQRLTDLQTSQPAINAIALEDQIKQIRTTLKRISNINRHLTSLRKSTDEIKNEAAHLKQEIRDVLDSMEDTISVS